MADDASTVKHQAAGLITEINLATDWSQDDTSHPGFVLTGEDNTPGRNTYYIQPR